MPVQNAGMETPTSAIAVVIRSKMEYCLVAEMMPIGSPIATITTTLSVASKNVVG